MENVDKGLGKKRGRKAKGEIKEVVVKEAQTKFFVDLSNDKDSLNLILNILKKCNEKDYGREILFKDLCLYSTKKLNDKDIEKIQESSLSEMEKVKKAMDEYNLKFETKLNLGEFLIKKLGIN